MLTNQAILPVQAVSFSAMPIANSCCLPVAWSDKLHLSGGIEKLTIAKLHNCYGHASQCIHMDGGFCVIGTFFLNGSSILSVQHYLHALLLPLHVMVFTWVSLSSLWRTTHRHTLRERPHSTRSTKLQIDGLKGRRLHLKAMYVCLQ